MSEESRYKSMTVAEALRGLDSNRFILPAIQRGFVWKPEQIEHLFDSLMQGYPIGAFLFWKVGLDSASRIKFYQFSKKYHERDGASGGEIPVDQCAGSLAVLDGQQRLSALYIGLCGDIAIRKRYGRWANDRNFRVAHLYLDLDYTPDENEGGRKYGFRLVIDDDKSHLRGNDGNKGKTLFKVSEIMEIQDNDDIPSLISRRFPACTNPERAASILRTLHGAIHDIRSINYYVEESDDLERALDVFLRLNSGGTSLSHSDLIFSIVVAHWGHGNGHKQINQLVKDINNIQDNGARFYMDKRFVLRACLMLTESKSVSFRVENFTSDQISKIRDSWSKIEAALTCTMCLLRKFQLTGATFTTPDAALPIAYYVYKHDLPISFACEAKYGDDRESIRRWLLGSLVTFLDTWTGSTDAMLADIRREICCADATNFPRSKIEDAMANRRKSPKVTEATLEELLNIQYGDRRARLLLSQMYPPVCPNEQFDVDHIFPTRHLGNRDGFVNDISANDEADLWRFGYALPNLQLLEKSENKSKSGKRPNEWLKQKYGDDEAARRTYCLENDFGDVPDGDRVCDLKRFWEARGELMRKRLAHVLGVDLKS